jgi:transcriptional regulator with XRE-family HTH domain
MRKQAPNTRLRFERIKRGLRQTELAQSVGMRNQVLCDIETGRIVPSPDELERLAAALHVWPPEILMREVRVILEDVEA